MVVFFSPFPLPYHCPNGNGRFSVFEVVELRRALFSRRIFSFEVFINDRTRRGWRFGTKDSSLSKDDRLLLSFVTKQSTKKLFFKVFSFSPSYLRSLICTCFTCRLNLIEKEAKKRYNSNRRRRRRRKDAAKQANDSLFFLFYLFSGRREKMFRLVLAFFSTKWSLGMMILR